MDQEEKRAKPREIARRYRERHPEKVKESSRRADLKRKEKKQAYYQATKEQRRERSRRYYLDHKERYREVARVWKYGITEEEMDQLWYEQGGCCAICGEQLENDACTHLDHDHETGKVRGFLCAKHNVGLSAFGDDPEMLERAAEYIRSHKQEEKPT